MSLCYLNGTFMPLDEARISPMDRGFLFGDAAYEVVPVYSHRPFRLNEHLARLSHTLDQIRLDNPHTSREWEGIVQSLVEASHDEDVQVYVQVSRGADRVRDQAFPKHVSPTVFAFAAPLVHPSQTVLAKGVSARSSNDIRWLRCDLKVTSLLANCLMRQDAVESGCAETILFRDDVLTEGAASNIFVVKAGALYAPPKDHLMLPGITYDVIIELAHQHGVPLHIGKITRAQVLAADELWMTSSTREVLAITTLDGQPVGEGVPGSLGKQMFAWYQAFKQSVMRGRS